MKKFNSLKINTTQVERTVLRIKKNVDKGLIPSPKWLSDLLQFIDDIQEKALNDSTYVIPSPYIKPVLKNKSKKEYRPICLFKLRDAIIIGQTAKYLTCCFDRILYSNSYAFRHKQESPTNIFNHHKAIEDILLYKEANKGDLYVAECDIKKFFDSICHKKIKEVFQSSVFDLRFFHGLILDKRAKVLFFQYLNCFTYTHNVHQQEQTILIRHGHKQSTIPWLDNKDFYDVGLDKNYDNIGVPQGGALSCLIANLILNQIDRQLRSLDDGRMFYARFCDDMVIIHPDKKICKSLFELYKDELNNLKLSYHICSTNQKYDRDHWQTKSKEPYKWAQILQNDILTHSNVPWLSFVGYQIRYECTLRVRKGSIEKELKKQVSETDKIIKSVNKVGHTNVSRKSVSFRLQQRLIAMSIGKVNKGEFSPSMCWTAGFKVLFGKTIIKTQIRKLDRNRERQIRRIISYTANVYPNKKRAGVYIKKEIRFGYKYSYFKQVL